MRKIIIMFASIAIMISTFAGCSEQSTSQSTSQSTASNSNTESTESSGYPTEIDMEETPYTVAIQVVALPGTSFEGKAEREAAINAITLPAINAEIEIQEVWISEVVNKTSMAVAGDEKIDLVHVATVNPLSSLVGSDILLDMNQDDLLQNRGSQLVSLFGDLLKSGFVNEQQLAIPANVFNASSKGIIYNKEITDSVNITIPDELTLDEFEQLLYQFQEVNETVMPFFVGEGNLNLLNWMENYESYGSEASYGAIMDPFTELKVENFYATDLFKDFCLRMYRWKQDGIIPGDPTDNTSGQIYFAANQLLTLPVSMNPMLELGYESANDFELGYSLLVDPLVTSSAITEYMWGIASNSERPDKAMDMLNFIYSNAEVANILNYGIEGANYNFMEESTEIIALNGSYTPTFFRAGNTADMHIVSPATETYHSEQMAFEESAEVSPVCYYGFDDTNFQTESAVINSTIEEYLPRLQNGMANSEEEMIALIDEFVSRLESAGINDVIAANQEQLDAWLATQ